MHPQAPALNSSAALSNPLRGNPLRSRDDVARAVGQLFEPLLPFFSTGGARIILGSSGAFFGEECESLEGFARPLFALIPLAMGGGNFAHWELFQRGLEHGTDPKHPEFWGFAGTDQRMVEMAAIGMALAFVKEQVFTPLSPRAQRNVITWLRRINQHPLPNCNWHFFRVLVNLGLSAIGETPDVAATAESWSILDSHYDGDGFYHDGALDRVDYYLPWAYHTYGLIYAASPHADVSRRAQCRERARLYAPHFMHWFDAQGRGIPFGRSLTYRFAQAALWGALVFADETVIPWARLKGLYLRQLRYWSTLPIADRDGVLSLGYAYSNLQLCEPYSSSGSPYWCMKAFLALAAPENHPFWQAEEESAEEFSAALPAQHAEPHAGMLFIRDSTQAVLLSAGQHELSYSNTPAKYGKFAYSSAFGFSISVPETLPRHNSHDSMLALREDSGPFRVRVESTERRVGPNFVVSRWQPWPDVDVTTLLLASELPWHFRVHYLRSSRTLHSAEQGFALGLGRSQAAVLNELRFAAEHGVLLSTEHGSSGIVAIDLNAVDGLSQPPRLARVLTPPPNTHLLWPRTTLPSLEASLAPGRHLLACAVFCTEASLSTTSPPAVPPLPPIAYDLLDVLLRT